MTGQDEKPSQTNERLEELRAAILDINYERGIKELENDPNFQRDSERWAKKFTEEHFSDVKTR